MNTIFPYVVEGRKKAAEAKAGGEAPTYGPYFTLAGFVSEDHAKNFVGSLNLHKRGFDDFNIREVPH